MIPASAFTHTVTERFLRYVVIDTQSDASSPTCPSTEKQKDLGRLLASELQAMGVADAQLDAHGYVYATIPANTTKKVPVICFCSHMDTSPDCSGKNVKPQMAIAPYLSTDKVQCALSFGDGQQIDDGLQPEVGGVWRAYMTTPFVPLDAGLNVKWVTLPNPNIPSQTAVSVMII